MSMDKTYDPHKIEQNWYQTWESEGYFAPRGDGPAYTVMLPPPNVTGTLHMGHAFQHTLQDVLIRYHRMRGDRTLWQMGTDHAGIATEMVVARRLATEGIQRNDLSRDEFIQRVWDWKKESGSTITRQMRRMGTSGDWSRERFTMDDGLSEAVRETFTRLHEQGLIYRGERLVNWDPVLKTAISDLEVESKEEQGSLWSIRYPLSDGSGSMVVATTRPETMLGDVAVAVNPDDERYRDFIGKTLKLPLTDREIPIIADHYVDQEFGTGCVKITPAHDFNDYEVGKRHDLRPINIFTDEAAINDFAPERFRGLDRYEARKQMLAELEAEGFLVETKAHKLMVPRGDRSGQVIEPYLTQHWFVKMDKLAKRGLELVESGEVEFVPANWINTYRHWLNNIQDWCISRQLWWGHRIPAWYGDDGRYWAARDEEEAQQKAAADGYTGTLRQDDDVLETWFSSALWCHSTLGWPNADAMQELGYEQYLPSSVLVTGFDIIFFWVARMIMMTDHFTGQVPFKQVYIHGLVRDKDGNKMSKSKGNILDPLDIIDGITLDDLLAKRTKGLMQPQMVPAIEKATRQEFPEGIPSFGADALRFTFSALATPGRDIKFDMARCEGYRNFCNKLWNAARFVFMHAEKPVADVTPVEGAAERWIRSRLQQTVANAHQHMSDYRFDLLAQELYEFTWNEFCDWYLELAKVNLTDDADPAARMGTRQTLLEVLDAILRLLHPVMPFITEEIWQTVRGFLQLNDDSLMLASYPTAQANDAAAEAEIHWLQGVIQAIRATRTELNLAPGKPLPVVLLGGDADDRRRWQEHSAWLSRLARVGDSQWSDASEPPNDAAVALAGNLRIAIPLAGLVDVAEEVSRLEKQLQKAQQELTKSEKKLSNQRFVDNAPEAVVTQEKERLEQHRANTQRYQEQLDRMRKMAS
ncbi:MAG: valine--tRNA ligase [Xanthomonadales bacterium]|nr:valine--tRNA ligase [Xanthomonadales bacterium]